MSVAPGGRPPLVERMQGFGETIFAEMSALALRTGSVNLGQGFPDTDGPDVIAEAAIDAIRAGHNQYPPGIGTRELLHAVADHQRRFYDIDLDPDAEVLVTAGATEAITAAVLALCDAGDEVLMFEPYYDSYAACVALARAERRVVTLRPPHYAFDPDELEAAVTPRTRVVLLNTPHNPTGKVFSSDELAHIARLAVEHDLLVVTDEVYEHLVYDGAHHPIAGFPGMADRTITTSSAGKTFSFTGWKIGWATGPAELIAAVRTVKQYLTYVNGAPFQHAVVAGLALGDDYFATLRADLRAQRDVLCAGLRDAGFEVFAPAGTYFATADIRPLGADDGRAFCLALPERCGVVAVPNVVFYDNEDEGRHLVRFAFCKRRQVLEEAVRRLAGLTG